MQSRERTGEVGRTDGGQIRKDIKELIRSREEFEISPAENENSLSKFG